MSEVAPYILPEGATRLSDGTVEYTLLFPIHYKTGSEEHSVNTVKVRRKRMDDNLAIAKIDDPIDIAFLMIQRLCDLDPAPVRLMDDIDSDAIGSIIEGFTQPGQRNGSRSAAS